MGFKREEKVETKKKVKLQVAAMSSVELDPREDMRELRPQSVDDLKKFQIGKREEQGTNIGTQLEREVEEAVVKVVMESSDLFTWSTTNMPDVDPSIICHKLSLCPDAKPISQKKMKLGEEMRGVVEEETKWLVKAGFIREIKYTTWLANVVLVKKASGKWRMCTDYCYRVMPFRIKNAGTTCQRLMDKVFEEQIGKKKHGGIHR